MNVVAMVCAVLLSTTGLLCIWRIARGPTTLDRTVAADVFVSACVGVIGVEAAVTGRDTSLAILVAMSLVAFIGSVSVAKYVAAQDQTPVPDQPLSDQPLSDDGVTRD